jgi:hypothetical protein
MMASAALYPARRCARLLQRLWRSVSGLRETVLGDPHRGVFHDNHLELGPLPVYWTEQHFPLFGMLGLDLHFAEEHRLGLLAIAGGLAAMGDPLATSLWS